jgi:twitching motility protein PilT
MTERQSLEYVEIDELLRIAAKAEASDVHLSCGTPPRYRIDGDLYEIPGYSEVTERWMNSQLEKISTSAKWQEFSESFEADFVHPVEGVGRFRVNAFVQKATPASVMRLIPAKIPILSKMGMPAILTDLADRPSGLILVTGETGSGKSTTLAAMMNERNETKRDHIMTIEDPVEFAHTSKLSLVNQREVGSDTKSFAEALKRVLRQDPDVILIGELRDAETISTALTAAETGHLVFGTLHTQSAAKSIDRIIDSFPSHQQNQVRSQISDTLQAVIAQVLVKKIGGGRVAATEILVQTNAISNLIREGDLKQVYSAIQTGKAHGMHTLDQDLKRLVGAGLVDREEVRDLLIDKDALDGISAKAVTSTDWSYDG